MKSLSFHLSLLLGLIFCPYFSTSSLTMVLGLRDALTAHHSVFYFMSLEVEEHFYFNVLVIPCVQLHIAVPGISSLTEVKKHRSAPISEFSSCSYVPQAAKHLYLF